MDRLPVNTDDSRNNQENKARHRAGILFPAAQISQDRRRWILNAREPGIQPETLIV